MTANETSDSDPAQPLAPGGMAALPEASASSEHTDNHQKAVLPAPGSAFSRYFWSGLGVLAIVLLAGWLLLPFYQSYRLFQFIETHGGLCQGQSSLPDWLQERVPENWLSLFLNVEEVEFQNAHITREETQELLNRLARSRTLTRLTLSNIQFTDDELPLIGQLKHLQILNLHGCPITGRGFAAWEPLPELKCLDLSETMLTDAGLQALEKQAVLSLNLSRTQLTEACPDSLDRFPRLKVVGFEKLPWDDEEKLTRLRGKIFFILTEDQDFFPVFQRPTHGSN